MVSLNKKHFVHLLLVSWTFAQNINNNMNTNNNNQTIQHTEQQSFSSVSINLRESPTQRTTSSNTDMVLVRSSSSSSLQHSSVSSDTFAPLSSLASSSTLSTDSSISTSISSSSLSSSLSSSTSTSNPQISSSSSSSFTIRSSQSFSSTSSQTIRSSLTSSTTSLTSVKSTISTASTSSLSSSFSSPSSILSTTLSSSTSRRVSSTSPYFTQSTTYPSTDPRHIVTRIIHGETILSNYYTTITYSATATSVADSKDSTDGHKGLSKKNKNIVIGCVVGIGVPLLIFIIVLIYIFCIQSKKTNFIDSNGNVVTAYKRNKFMKLWYSLIGKNVNDEEYESTSPLGSAGSEEEMIMEPSTLLNIDDEIDNGVVNRNESTPTSNTDNANQSVGDRYNKTNNNNIYGQEGSNDLMIPEERYYDEHGNELNAKNY